MCNTGNNHAEGAMQSRPLIILFLKAPIPGNVKSRLAAGIGQEAALELYRLLVLDTVDVLSRTVFPVRIYFSPPEAADAVAALLGKDRGCAPQTGADLGERMANALHDAFSRGHTHAVLVGSDIPELTPAIITEALDSLERNEAALGPAEDGGYYLIGFRSGAMLPAVFHGRAWSTSTVFEETARIMREKSLRVHMLPRLHDLDSAADLKDLWERDRNAKNRKSRVLEYIEKHRNSLFGSGHVKPTQPNHHPE